MSPFFCGGIQRPASASAFLVAGIGGGGSGWLASSAGVLNWTCCTGAFAGSLPTGVAGVGAGGGGGGDASGPLKAGIVGGAARAGLP